MFQPQAQPVPSAPTNTPTVEDVPAEMLLLGRILALSKTGKANAAYAQAQVLTFSDFSQRKHGIVWRAMQRIIEAGETISITAIEGEFLKVNNAEVASSDLYALMQEARGDIPACLKRIQTASLRRKGLAMTRRMDQIFTDKTLSPDQMGDKLSDESARYILDIQALANRKNVSLFDDLNTHAQQFEDNRRAMSAGEMDAFGIPSGYQSLDNDMGMNGFKRNTVTVVAGRPGDGKTSVLLNFALNAMKNGARVTFIPLEMTHLEMTNRLMGIESSLDTIDLATGNLHPDDLALFSEARTRIQGYETSKTFTYLDFPPRPTMGQIEARLREHIATTGTDLVIFDQMSLQCVSRSDPRQRDDAFMAEMIAALKAWVHVKMFNIPLIAGAQSNRAAEQQGGKNTTATLANSDAIGQTADMVIQLDRDKSQVMHNGLSRTDWNITKHRGGREGTIEMLYHTSSTRFVEAGK